VAEGAAVEEEAVPDGESDAVDCSTRPRSADPPLQAARSRAARETFQSIFIA
jgi:hypothetical protein